MIKKSIHSLSSALSIIVLLPLFIIIAVLVNFSLAFNNCAREMSLPMFKITDEAVTVICEAVEND